MSNQRKKYLDLVKTLAIAFVIYNHTGQEGFLSFIPWGNTFSSILKVILSVLCKTAVPLFFMCSGALLLSKEEIILDILKKKEC